MKISLFSYIIKSLAGMAELVDAQDLKSCAEQSACRFDPGSRQESLSGNREAFFMFVGSRPTMTGSSYDTTRISAPVRIQIN